VQNASTITGVSGNNRIYLLETTTSGTTYTLSFYAKKGTSSTIGLDFINVSSGTTFNFDTKSWGTNAAWDLFDYEELDNGWFRLYGVIDSNTTSAGIGIYVESGETAYVFGAQLEAGSYPSSYIPTMGTTETRAADSCLGAGDSSLFNVNGGVLFGEFSAFYDDGTFRQMGISGSTGNEVNLSFDSTSNRIGGIVRSGGTYYVLSHVVSDTTINTKVALKYKVNDLALYVDGVEVDSLSSAAMPTSLNEFNFAIGTTNSNVFYGNVKQVAVFNEALSDSELATLTTL
jgi:hypothetical protein